MIRETRKVQGSPPKSAPHRTPNPGTKGVSGM
jgi:hypothetical protein